MPRGKKELAEQIIPKLREVEVEVGRGKTVLEAVKKIGVTEQTYYRWKKKFGGLRIDQAKRLKDLVSRRLKPASDRRMNSGRLHGALRPTGFLAATPQKEACHGECIEDGDYRGDPFLTIGRTVLPRDRETAWRASRDGLPAPSPGA